MSDMTVGGVINRPADKEAEYAASPLPGTGQAAGGANETALATPAANAGPAYKVDLSQQSSWQDPEVREMKRTGRIECYTCKSRTYQDGSNDPGVSFKAPGHISPESSAAVVNSHEQEHVSNERAKAKGENRRVISQNVQIFTSVCPECGRVYVSGGKTSTTTAAEESQNQQAQKQAAQTPPGAAI